MNEDINAYVKSLVREQKKRGGIAAMWGQIAAEESDGEFLAVIQTVQRIGLNPILPASALVDYSKSKLVIGFRGMEEIWKRMSLRRDANARDRRKFRRAVRKIESGER